jgi:tetratricopeptide (TPR) repeat protein
MKYRLFILLLLNQYLFGFSTSLNTTDKLLEAKRLLKEASVSSDTSLIIKAKEILAKVYETDSQYQNLYFIAQSEYELARLAFAYKKYDAFEKHYNEAVKYIEKLISEKPNWSEPHTLLSLLYGYKIAKNSIYAVTLGPKAYLLIQRALELDDKNPRAWFVMGIIKFHMPGFLGGGTEEAISAFKKSIELFESKKEEADPLTPDWGYIDALLWLGWVYEKDKQPKEAYLVYRNALILHPQAKWIYSIFLEPLQKRYNIN